MGISLKPEHLKRYRDIAGLLIKYGRRDLVASAGLDEALDNGEVHGDAVPAEARELADDLERLGPTYVKLGQLLSTRGDLLPQAYTEALTRLQDDVAPIPFDEVERIVQTELGVRLSKAFSYFHAEPTASASLGQVHRAALRDGTEVVVKVQRPHIREQIIQDLDALSEVAEFVDSHTEVGKRYHLGGMLDEFRKSLLQELDYRQEAQNLKTLGANLAELDRILVPQPFDSFTTDRVLTMEYVGGKKATELDQLSRLEIDTAELADQLFQAYLKQILVDGFFHADPHPGNVFVTDDGRLALLDLGMVARIPSRLQDQLLRLLLATSEGRGDDAANVALEIGEKTGEADEEEFRRRIGQLVVGYQDASIRQIEFGAIVLEEVKASGECGVRLPPELTMLGKALLNLDHVGRALDPDFDPNAAIRRHAAKIIRQQMFKGASPASLLSGLIEAREFLERLPTRANRILDLVSNNDLRIKVDAIDESLLLAGAQKIANRITLGLILAALIIGAAMLMSIPTDFRILGYPGIAILFFLAAAGGGLALVLTILVSDVHSRR